MLSVILCCLEKGKQPFNIGVSETPHSTLGTKTAYDEYLSLRADFLIAYRHVELAVKASPIAR